MIYDIRELSDTALSPSYLFGDYLRPQMESRECSDHTKMKAVSGILYDRQEAFCWRFRSSDFSSSSSAHIENDIEESCMNMIVSDLDSL